MLNVGRMEEGIVLDHIKAGYSMSIYNYLNLDKLDCSVAIIKNAVSQKMGRKDIIKIDSPEDIDLGVIGFVDPDATINVIRDGKLVEKKKLVLPKKLKNVIKCRNPRCITSIEEGIDHIFVLGENQRYRCAYCEQEYRPKSGKHR